MTTLPGYTGTLTGSGERAGRGSGRTIVSFTHAAAFTTDALPASSPPPALFEPSPEKLRLTDAAR